MDFLKRKEKQRTLPATRRLGICETWNGVLGAPVSMWIMFAENSVIQKLSQRDSSHNGPIDGARPK